MPQGTGWVRERPVPTMAMSAPTPTPKMLGVATSPEMSSADTLVFYPRLRPLASNHPLVQKRPKTVHPVTSALWRFFQPRFAALSLFGA